MKKFYCDICKKEMPYDVKIARIDGRIIMIEFKVSDVCRGCQEMAGNKLKEIEKVLEEGQK